MSGTIIKNYSVRLKYFVQSVGKNAQVVERELEEDVELCMLARTSPAHTAFATKLLMNGGDPDLEVLCGVAKRLCELIIVNEKQRNAILNDSMACLDLYSDEAVQKDIERFLSGWGVVRKLGAAGAELHPDESPSLTE